MSVEQNNHIFNDVELKIEQTEDESNFDENMMDVAYEEFEEYEILDDTEFPIKTEPPSSPIPPTPTPTIQATTTTTTPNHESDIYHCYECNIRFNSVSDHVSKYHNDQMVILEVNDEKEEVQPSNKSISMNKQKMDDGKNVNRQETSIKMNTKSNTSKIGKPTKMKVIRPDKEKEINQFICAVCSQMYRSKRGLRNHKCLKGTGEIPNRAPYRKELEKCICDICQTVFQSQKSLKLHARMHDPNKRPQKTMKQTYGMNKMDQQYKNNNADYDNDDVDDVDDDDDVDNEGSFHCEICDKSYDNTLKVIHMKTHKESTDLVCLVCNKIFTDKELMALHLNVHQDKLRNSPTTKDETLNRQYACSHCGKKFLRPHEKVKHERVHTGERPHKCDVCGKCFRVSYCLTLHMRTHTDFRPYVCQICSKRFKSQSVYSHHILTHSDLRPYQCPYCPKAFKTSVQLAGHRNGHTKPFSCPECNRPFASLFAVKGHMESHKRSNNNLKHVCLICGAVYARGFALKDHIAEQHPDAKDTIDDTETIQSGGGVGVAARGGVGKKGSTSKINIKSETKMAEESILPDHGNEEVEIYCDIDHFATEEVITDDWL